MYCYLSADSYRAVKINDLITFLQKNGYYYT